MFVTYLRRELRRRARQASIIALGLALGIGLVITVTALSSGVKNAQGAVLHSLYGLDTDITVTKAPTAGNGGSGTFGFRGAFGTGQRPAPGTKIDVDNLRNVFGYGSLTDANLNGVSKLHDVAAAAGGLMLNDTKITGKIPAINFGGGNGGPAGSGSGGGTFQASLKPSNFTVDGVELASKAAALGPLSNSKLASGRTFSSTDADSNVALVDSGYAKSQKLAVGSTITVAKKSFKVIGIVTTPAATNSSDVYIPLARAQKLAGMAGQVNTIYVAANSAANIDTVSNEISRLLPKATVTNSSDLDKQITGSVASASSLASNLGRWLAVAVLIAAFLLASLLTMSAVSRRVREFGTLKALGWKSRRVIGQVLGEAVVIGIIGAVIGVGLGFLGAALIDNFAKPLTASVGPTTGSATPGGAKTFGGPPGGSFPGGGNSNGFAGRFVQNAESAAHTVTVHLSAPVTAGAIAAAVLLAIAGGLIAGSFGGWRAARLRPAAALARVE
ncbi:MAG TPA: ABC transporter permease [Streptosporangiaceae bacterium]|nr:ABC transporter permease [Streptosporangiaceae bacterium]